MEQRLHVILENKKIIGWIFQVLQFETKINFNTQIEIHELGVTSF